MKSEPEINTLLQEWHQAQCDWPNRLCVGDRSATLEQCQHWLQAARGWLQSPRLNGLTSIQVEAIQLFVQRVIIQRGDLLADPFQCSLSECG